jgi:nucleoside-diphosphate-sugar epimerase
VKTLVTGANGFLGLYITEQLVAAGHAVRALVRQPAKELATLGVETALGDIRDAAVVEAACADRDVVFHVAGVAGIWGAWEHFYGINTLGTQHVLSGCRRHGVRRLVFTSSPSVTFSGDDQDGVDESAPYPQRWLCHYQHTKALAEQEVLAANCSSLATCALRPHLIWGPRDRHLIPRLFERARRGQLRQVGNGANRIDTIYVENAAEAHLAAADSLERGEAGGRAYFLSQGEPVLCWQWINELLARGGMPRVTRSISTATAWRIGGGLEAVYRLLRLASEPRMTRFLAAQLGRSHWFDISAARRDLGYVPRISTAAGLERLFASLGSRPTT